MATGKEFWEGVANGEITNMQINTFQPFQSPVDFKMINNSAELKAHNKRHNVEQVGNQYEQTVNDKREEANEQKRDTERSAYRG